MKKKPLARVLAILMSAAMLVSCLAVSASAGVILSTLTDVNNYAASLMNVTNNGLDVASSGLDALAGGVNIAANTVNLDNSAKKDLTSTIDLTTSNIKLGGALASNGLDTATSAVKLGTAGADNVAAVTDLTTSNVKLLSNTANGLKEGAANTLGIANNGLKLADTVGDVADPLPKVNTGLSLFNNGYTFVENIKEIKENNDNKNAANEDAPVSAASEVNVAENTNA